MCARVVPVGFIESAPDRPDVYDLPQHLLSRAENARSSRRSLYSTVGPPREPPSPPTRSRPRVEPSERAIPIAARRDLPGGPRADRLIAALYHLSPAISRLIGFSGRKVRGNRLVSPRRVSLPVREFDFVTYLATLLTHDVSSFRQFRNVTRNNCVLFFFLFQ